MYAQTWRVRFISNAITHSDTIAPQLSPSRYQSSSASSNQPYDLLSS
jgi:hypothetical protein